MKNKIIFLVFNLFFSSFAYSMESNQIDNDRLGKALLLKAAKNNNIEKVKELIKSGADVNAKDSYGNTLLAHASRSGNKEIVDALIKAGAYVNAKSNRNDTALILASLKGHKEIVELLINSGADVNAKDDIGYTALIWASYEGHKEIVELLINAGADVNAKDLNSVTTPIIIASGRGHKEIVELLIEEGVEVNSKDQFGNTALIAAAKSGYKVIVELLWKNINSWKQEVYKAIDNNDIENFKKYILKIGTICFKDKNKNNLLHYAMEHGKLELTKLIFSINPKLIGQINNGGQTPLSFIGTHGEFIKLFKELLLNQDKNNN